MVIAAVLFLSPTLMATAGGLLSAAIVTAAVRRVRLGRAASAMVVGGGIGWALAAGTPVWDRPAARLVAVMVDLSPSTRGATYRDRAALDRRVARLLGDVPHELLAFAGGPPRPLPPGATLADVPCDRTTFVPPPDADAVLLFSDGRFEPPAVAPPTFPVVDPGLEDPPDAAVRDLRWADDGVTATVVAPGPAVLHWTGADPPTADATGGGVVIARPTSTDVTAAVDGHDRWPEDDRLSVHAPPPAVAERWWVGRSPPPPGFRAVSLPTDPADYLAAAVIVLDDVPADAVSTAQQQQLAAYVCDAGGGLVIGGGASAFAAGGYGSTPLDAVSPLAGDPPTPAERWVVLVDGSGSMATADGPGPTPWQVECDAVARVLSALPPADPVRVGSFAAAVTWWGDAVPAADVHRSPPPGLVPTGVTNLAAAVDRVLSGTEPAVPTHLLLMTDADADLPDAAGLTARLRARRVTLHVLATGTGRALADLRSAAARSGGTVVEQTDPAGWVAAARRLARQAVPRRYTDRPTPVAWTGFAGPATVAGWNRTWLKPTADRLAAGPDAPLAAEWRVGTGRVIAAAFAADPATLARLAERVAAAPHDPRFTVTWDEDAHLRVSVDAVDHGRFLNGLPVTLVVGEGRPMAVPQTAPGEYAANVAAPPRPALGIVRADGRVVDRFAVPGRYPPEFDVIGNDRPALAALADRTGGRVVEPTETAPLTFPGPPRRTPLGPPLAAAGAAAVAAGLVRWRRGRWA